MPWSKDNSPVKELLPDTGVVLWNKVANERLAAGDSESVAIKKAWSVVGKSYKKGKGKKWVKK